MALFRNSPAPHVVMCNVKQVAHGPRRHSLTATVSACAGIGRCSERMAHPASQTASKRVPTSTKVRLQVAGLEAQLQMRPGAGSLLSMLSAETLLCTI
jgi:hypothetical protein